MPALMPALMLAVMLALLMRVLEPAHQKPGLTRPHKSRNRARQAVSSARVSSSGRMGNLR